MSINVTNKPFEKIDIIQNKYLRGNSTPQQQAKKSDTSNPAGDMYHSNNGNSLKTIGVIGMLGVGIAGVKYGIKTYEKSLYLEKNTEKLYNYLRKRISKFDFSNDVAKDILEKIAKMRDETYKDNLLNYLTEKYLHQATERKGIYSRYFVPLGSKYFEPLQFEDFILGITAADNKFLFKFIDKADEDKLLKNEEFITALVNQLNKLDDKVKMNVIARLSDFYNAQDKNDLFYNVFEINLHNFSKIMKAVRDIKEGQTTYLYGENIGKTFNNNDALMGIKMSAVYSRKTDPSVRYAILKDICDNLSDEKTFEFIRNLIEIRPNYKHITNFTSKPERLNILRLFTERYQKALQNKNNINEDDIELGNILYETVIKDRENTDLKSMNIYKSLIISIMNKMKEKSIFMSIAGDDNPFGYDFYFSLLKLTYNIFKTQNLPYTNLDHFSKFADDMIVLTNSVYKTGKTDYVYSMFDKEYQNFIAANLHRKNDPLFKSVCQKIDHFKQHYRNKRNMFYSPNSAKLNSNEFYTEVNNNFSNNLYHIDTQRLKALLADDEELLMAISDFEKTSMTLNDIKKLKHKCLRKYHPDLMRDKASIERGNRITQEINLIFENIQKK